MSHWDACTSEPNVVLRWIECHPGLAGYLQFAGAVIAVVVAWKAPAIAAHFADRQKAEEAERERLFDLKNLRRIAQDLDFKIRVSRDLLQRITGNAPNQQAWESHFDQMPLPIFELRGALPATGDSRFEPFERLVEEMQRYNNAVLDARSNGRSSVHPWSHYWQAMNDALASVETLRR